MNNSISPFAGNPHTDEVKDRKGNTVFYVRPRFLTPLRVKLAEFLAVMSVLGLMVAGLCVLSHLPQPPNWLWLAVVAGPWVATPLLNQVLRVLLTKEVLLVLTVEQFKVRTLWGWRCYDRLLPHTFGYSDHRKARAEMDDHDFERQQAQSRRKAYKPRRYYTQSFHVCFVYAGRRINFLTVYGPEAAREIVERLQQCDASLNEKAGTGDGLALDPEDQWNDQSGDVPG